MNQRHLARVVSLQTLYQIDFIGLLDKKTEDSKEQLDKIFNYCLKEFSSPSFLYNDFIKKLTLGIIENREKIDQWIKKFASEWPIKQISIIDRNILRIGIFELIFSKETPPKVAIDESIELAKRFGSETSGRFVNGVLGAIFEQLKGSIHEDEPTAKSE